MGFLARIIKKMNRNPDYKSIDPEKAKELLKSGRAKPAKGSGLIDMPSLVASLGAFSLIVILVAIYIELFMDTRIMKNYVPQEFPTEEMIQISENAILIEQAVVNGLYAKADSLLQLELYEEKPEKLDMFLWCYTIELRLAGKRYQEAIEMSRTVQSRYPKNAKVLASLFWYKAHAYYYMGEFRESHKQLATLILLQDERYLAKAQIYSDKLYELFRADGLNVFFD